jgi:hypothetical protein
MDAMANLEAKTHDAQRDMAVADALDEIRAQNARNEKAAVNGEAAPATVVDVLYEKRQRQDEEDAEAARQAFEKAKEEKTTIPDIPKTTPAPVFKRTKPQRKDFAAALGIKFKKKTPA